MDEITEKVLRVLERNHVTVADMARYAGTDVAKARRVLDTISFDRPVYEVRRGVYGMLPKGGGREGPRGFIARARAAERLERLGSGR